MAGTDSRMVPIPRRKQPMTEHQFPVAGILDVHGDSAFLRTEGYLPGPDDVFVPPAMVRKYGLRRGDELTGIAGPAAAAGFNNRGNRPRPKHDPLVQLDSVNGRDPEEARRRPEFTK